MKNKLLVITFLCVHAVMNCLGQNSSILPEIILRPNDYYIYSTASRKFSGIPTIALTPENRMWAAWYTGITPGEDRNNYIVLTTSDDKGNKWEEVLVIDPDGKGPVRAFDPQLWMAPDGCLWLFWAQAEQPDKTLPADGVVPEIWAMKTLQPEVKEPCWSIPEKVASGVMATKPLVLSTGEWLLPVSTWKKTAASAKVYISDNHGKSWSLRGACDIPEEVRDYDEHAIVERKDGTLWMLVRTKYGIGESFSRNKGKTWSECKPSGIPHVNSRFFIRRLQSGNLLLVKHGSANQQTIKEGEWGGRTHLMAFISKDDGLSWSKGLLIDERKEIAYPDGQQTDDGKIYIIYDYNRYKEQGIYMTDFTEADILSENYDDSILHLYNRRKIVSQAGK